MLLSIPSPSSPQRNLGFDPSRCCVQKSGRHGAGDVCQICPDGLGTTMDGEVLTAFDVCRFPVYVHERKEGTQACL